MKGLKLFTLSICLITSFSSYSVFGQDNYPILQEINDSEALFFGKYTFEDCKDVIEKLKVDIENFKMNGTADEADDLKDNFLKAKETIARALYDLEEATNDDAMKHEIHEYIWEKLDLEITIPVWEAYREARERI